MKISYFRKPLAIVLSAASLLSSQAVFASSVRNVPVNAMFAKTSTVHLNLHNISDAAVELKVGDQVVTIAAGKTISVNVPPGTRIVTNTATKLHPAGELVFEAASDFNNATVSIG